MPVWRKPPQKKQTAAQMRKAIAQRPLGSIWAQVRRTPDLGRKEMGWVARRRNPGIMNPAAQKRRVGEVEFKSRQYIRSETHTHIRDSFNAGAMPSEHDVADMLYDVGRTKIRTWHVLSVSRWGEPLGVVTVHATKRFVTWVRRHPDKVSDVRRMLGRQHRYHSVRTRSGLINLAEVMEHLQERGLNVRIRARPRYKFEHGKFVYKAKKPTKK